MGGQSEALTEAMRRTFKPGASLGDALRVGVNALGDVDKREVPARNLEVAVLDRSRERRKFRRLSERELAELLGSTAKGAGSSNGSSPGSGPDAGPPAGPGTAPPAEPGPPPAP
jgi:proteasome alpha subunit